MCRPIDLVCGLWLFGVVTITVTAAAAVTAIVYAPPEPA